jgi:hypothetical protein
MKIKADYWFNDMMGGCVGIVCAEDEKTGERKVYIGTGQGHSQGIDKQRILEGGQELPPSFLEGILRWLKPPKKAKKGGK